MARTIGCCNGGHGKWLDSGYMLKSEAADFNHGLDVGHERKRLRTTLGFILRNCG